MRKEVLMHGHPRGYLPTLEKIHEVFCQNYANFCEGKISLEYMSPALSDSFIDGLEDDVNVSVLSMMPYYGNALLVREKIFNKCSWASFRL